MNCQEFDDIVIDFVRGGLQPATRRDVMAHASNCRACAARLSDESFLSAGLRAWAMNSGRNQAPERLEAGLLEAFRTQAPLRVPTVSGNRTARLRLVAASILILLAATLIFLHQGGTRSPSTPLPPADSRVSAAPPAPATPIALPSAGRLVRETPLHRPAAQPKRPVVRRAGGRAASAPAEEITTGFIPLPYGSTLNLWEDGPAAKIHLIRMRLPRSALLTTGLPMNEERANEPILADVLFTEDGLARGIRFVN